MKTFAAVSNALLLCRWYADARQGEGEGRALEGWNKVTLGMGPANTVHRKEQNSQPTKDIALLLFSFAFVLGCRAGGRSRLGGLWGRETGKSDHAGLFGRSAPLYDCQSSTTSIYLTSLGHGTRFLTPFDRAKVLLGLAESCKLGTYLI